MLAMANRDGIVEASLPGLADAARVSMKDCEKGLAALMAPDPYSRTKDHDGRRIAEVDGGWEILNHAKYREKLSAEDRRERDRKRQAAWRERHKSGVTGDVTISHGPSRDVTDSPTKSRESRHAEAEAKADTPIAPLSGKTKRRASLDEVKALAVELGLPPADGEAFFYANEANGWTSGGKPIRDWQAKFRQWNSSGFHPSQKQQAAPNGHRAVSLPVATIEEHEAKEQRQREDADRQWETAQKGQG